MKTLILTLMLFWFAGDPWADKELVQAKVLADKLSAKETPAVFYVGFPMLYKSGAHVATAKLAGPCSKAEGLELLKKDVDGLARDKEVFIYCGCCPFVKCPNIRPAYAALKEMGFSNIKVVMLETNLHTDWVEKGYPVEKVTP